MTSSLLTDFSAETSVLDALTPEQRDRLTDLLDSYLSQLAGGVPPDVRQLLADHADLAEPLRVYLEQLEALHQAAGAFTPQTQDLPSPPSGSEKRLGDFDLRREIGRGGMGVVYEARQISLDRSVALKILPFAAVLDARQIARFKNEAQAAAQIQHPNIVPVYAIGAERGVHYYAMQLIDGQPLDQAITELRGDKSEWAETNGLPTTSVTLTVRDKPRDMTRARTQSLLTSGTVFHGTYFQTVAHLGIQAAEALHAAHEHGVVHRDIKPSNMLLDKYGKLWITDFGLARCQTDASLTTPGDLVGTLRYMSPEQALGKSACVDQRTDIYSLGITLYELLTLCPAFPDDNSRTLLAQIESQEPIRPRLLRPAIPQDLETIILKAISKSREERYETADLFAEDLRRFLEGRPTNARPPTVFDRVAKWARRHRRTVIMATSIGILLLLALSTSTFLIARANVTAASNLQRANENFQQARNIVDLGSNVAERLATIPGAETVRRDFLQELLAYYQDFSRQVSDDPSLRADLAATWAKIGKIRTLFGSRDEAIAAYRRSLQVFDDLCTQNPHAADYRRQVALCHNNLALLLSEMGDTAAAEASYQQALRSQVELSQDFPDQPTYKADLAVSTMNLALLREQKGDLANARQGYEQAIQVHQKLSQMHPDDLSNLERLAANHNNLASLFVDVDSDKALESYQSACVAYEQLVNRSPETTDYQNSLALTHNNLGALLSHTGQSVAAESAYSKAIEIQTKLVTAVPTLSAYRSDLALSYSNLGSLQTELQRPDDAIKNYRQALRLQKSLVAQYPQDVHYQSLLGGIYNNLGIALQEQKQDAAAAAAFQAAVFHQEKAFQAAPQVAQYRNYLSKHLFNYERVLRAVGRPIDAADAALCRRELWPDQPQRLFAVAEELALAVQMVRGDVLQRDWVAAQDAQVITILTDAIDAGLDLHHDLDWPAALDGIISREQAMQLRSPKPALLDGSS